MVPLSARKGSVERCQDLPDLLIGQGTRQRCKPPVGNRREWPMAYHPGNEQECRTSSHAQAKGTTRAVAVARASTGLTTHRPSSARVRAWCHGSRDPPLAVTGNPCASRMIPLESPVPEIGTPGSESGERKRAHGRRTAAQCESAGSATDPLPATRLSSTLPPSRKRPANDRLRCSASVREGRRGMNAETDSLARHGLEILYASPTLVLRHAIIFWYLPDPMVTSSTTWQHRIPELLAVALH